MTASPVWKPKQVLLAIQELESNLDAKLFEVKQADVLKSTPRPQEKCIQFDEAPPFEETPFERRLRELQHELKWDEKTWKRIAITKQVRPLVAFSMVH